jgi:uncharacterized protein YndB with AHSA1/START domain
MTADPKPARDLTISRVIRAPRAAIWQAWTDPRSFEQWWIPEPLKCRVMEMQLRPGGAFVTRMSENGVDYAPHMNACFLAAEEGARIVFTNVLLGGWRPAEDYYPTALTAVITFADHPQGTEYSAHVMHKNDADSALHDEMGFQDGWGTVLGQLARLLEKRA